MGHTNYRQNNLTGCRSTLELEDGARVVKLIDTPPRDVVVYTLAEMEFTQLLDVSLNGVHLTFA